MSVIAAAVKAMLDAGVPHERIVEAVAEMEAAAAPVRTKRQERDRRYYEAHRDQKIAAAKARYVELRATENDGSDGKATENDGKDGGSSQDKVLPDPPKTQLSSTSKKDPKGSQKGSASRKNPWPENYRNLFWQAYPKHVEKKAAMDALDAEHRRDRLPWDVLLAGIAGLISHVDPKFHPAPHRWLKGERWNDQHRPTGPPNGSRNSGRNAFLDIAFEANERVNHERRNLFDDDPTVEILPPNRRQS